MPVDLRQLGTPIETKDGAQSKVDSHENSTSGVHGVGGSDVASTADVSSIQSSSDVDHDQTSNRTHDGDELSPESVVSDLFGLPSGWTLTENVDGEAVFEDSGGNVILRRDSTNGEWVTDSIDAESVDVVSLSGDLVSRPEAIDNLEGNVYLEPNGTDPETVLENDGDMVFIHD